MKLALTVILGLLISTSSLTAQSQYDPKALETLKAMSATYKNIPSFRAKIVSNLKNESEGVNEKFSGEITVKGDKYWLKLDEQEVINNGKTTWTYLVDLNEVNVENYRPDEDEITPSKIYSTDYTNGYKYLLIGEVTKNGVLCEEIDLVPDAAKKAQYFKIKLFISNNDKTLQSWTLFDKSGNQYVYNITDFNPKVNVSDAYFNFDKSKYPGVEVVDLRQ